MNKFALFAFFSFILFSSTALACEFCYVKNINCPTSVQLGQEFSINFEFSGTGPDYPYEYVSLVRDGTSIGCVQLNKQACIWNSHSFTTKAPDTPGSYKYTVRCYAADSIAEGNCGMEDDSSSCTVNVVSSVAATYSSDECPSQCPIQCTSGQECGCCAIQPDWSFACKVCPAGKICVGTTCKSGCTDECSPQYKKECYGSSTYGGIKTCVRKSDGCLGWSYSDCPYGCDPSTVKCKAACTSECNPSTTPTRCNGDMIVEKCVDKGGGCYKWEFKENCLGNYKCVNGACKSGGQWSISLSASSTTPAVGTSVTLTATTNKDVGGTGYRIIILVSGTNVIKSCVSGTTCTATYSSTIANTLTFVAEVSNSKAEATSNSVSVTWGGGTQTCTKHEDCSNDKYCDIFSGECKTLPVCSYTSCTYWNTPPCKCGSKRVTDYDYCCAAKSYSSTSQSACNSQCSIGSCSGYTKCTDCTSQSGCGWCKNNNGKCIKEGDICSSGTTTSCETCSAVFNAVLKGTSEPYTLEASFTAEGCNGKGWQIHQSSMLKSSGTISGDSYNSGTKTWSYWCSYDPATVKLTIFDYPTNKEYSKTVQCGSVTTPNCDPKCGDNTAGVSCTCTGLDRKDVFCCESKGPYSNKQTCCENCPGYKWVCDKDGNCECKEDSGGTNKCTPDDCSGKVTNKPCVCGNSASSLDADYCCGATSSGSDYQSICKATCPGSELDQCPANYTMCEAKIPWDYTPCMCGNTKLEGSNNYCCAGADDGKGYVTQYSSWCKNECEHVVAECEYSSCQNGHELIDLPCKCGSEIITKDENGAGKYCCAVDSRVAWTKTGCEQGSCSEGGEEEDECLKYTDDGCEACTGYHVYGMGSVQCGWCTDGHGCKRVGINPVIPQSRDGKCSSSKGNWAVFDFQCGEDGKDVDDPCSDYTDDSCKICTGLHGGIQCGWCTDTNECKKGAALGSLDGECNSDKGNWAGADFACKEGGGGSETEWSVTLSAASKEVKVDEEVTLTAIVNKDVQGTGYEICIYEKDMVSGTCIGYGTTQTKIVSSDKLITKTYIAKIMKGKSVIETSSSVNVKWGEAGSTAPTSGLIVFREQTQGEFFHPSTTDNWSDIDNYKFIEKFYEVHGDYYDFIVLYPIEKIQSSYSYVVNRNILGIDEDYETTNPNTKKLNTMAVMSDYDIWEFLRRPKDIFENNVKIFLIHEIAHHWLAFVDITENCVNHYHWPNNIDLFSGDTHYVDIMGFYQWVIKGNEEICVNGNSKTSIPAFSDLSLYLMGLIPPEEVSPIFVHEFEEKKNDPIFNKYGPTCIDEHKFTGTKTVTIQDIIKKYGERIPSYESSQKNFNVAFVILAEKDKDIPSEFVDYVNRQREALPKAWSEATNGKSKIEYNKLDEKSFTDVNKDTQVAWDLEEDATTSTGIAALNFQASENIGNLQADLQSATLPTTVDAGNNIIRNVFDINTDQAEKISKIIIKIKIPEEEIKDMSNVFLGHVIDENTGEVEKIAISCQIADGFCEDEITVTSASTFFISVGEKEECPHECCVGETNYTDKSCTTGYECADNQCVSTTEKQEPTTDNTFLIILIGGGLGAIVLVLIVYFILKRNRNRKPKESFDELYKKYGKKKPRRLIRRVRR